LPRDRSEPRYGLIRLLAVVVDVSAEHEDVIACAKGEGRSFTPMTIDVKHVEAPDQT
jgi:hypothetical protein